MKTPTKKNKVRPGQTVEAAHAVLEAHKGAEFVKPGELVEARAEGGIVPSLAARRAFALMLAEATLKPSSTDLFRIPKRVIRNLHKSNDRIEHTIDQIMGTFWTVPVLSSRGRAALARVIVFERITTERADGTDDGYIEFRLGRDAARIIEQSGVWAQVNRAALMAFESKYALSLYEFGCLKSGMEYPVVKMTVKELRGQLGVEGAKYGDFGQLNKYVLKRAMSEVNQLAHFTVEAIPVRYGRRVTHVELRFYEKPDSAINEAAREAEKHRSGRRARRDGRVDLVLIEGGQSDNEAITQVFELDGDDHIPW